MPSTEIFISTKSGVSLFTMIVAGESTKDSNLLSGFLSAVNSFAEEMGWPEGVGLIRAKGMECRLVSGKNIFCALLIENSVGLGHMTDPTLNDLAIELLETFEKEFEKEINSALIENTQIFNEKDYISFKDSASKIIEKYRAQTFELYQKIILIESIYSKVPQKWCLPLMEELSTGVIDVMPKFAFIIKKYPHMKKVIQRVNMEQKAIWDIFDVPLYDPYS